MNSKNKKVIILIFMLLVTLIVGLALYNYLIKKYEVEEIVEEKYLLLSSNDKVGVIDNKGNIIIEPEYYEIHIPNPSKPIFVCYYDYNIQKGSYRTKIINEQGTELFTKYNNIQTIDLNDIQTSMPYEKSVLKYETAGKWGLIDLKGNIVTKAVYDSIDGLSNKEGELLISKDGKFGVINTKGAELIKTEYDYISGDGYYTAEEKYGLSGYVLGIKTQDGYRYGYMTYKRKWLLDTEYNEILKLGGIGSENTDKDIIMVAKKDGQYGLVKNKKVIIDFRYQSIDYSGTDNLFIVTRSSKTGVYNSWGDKILAVKYDEVDVKETHIETKSDNETAYYNLKGNRIDKSTIKEEKNEEKDEITNESTGKIIPKKKDGKWGFVDSNSNVVVEYKYDEVTELNNNGFAGIKLDGKWGSIDKNGNIIIEPTYNLDSSYEVDFIGKYYRVIYDYKTVYYSDDINQGD